MNPTEAIARLTGTVVPALRQLPAQLEPVAAQYVANYRQIVANPDLTADGRDRQVAEQRAGALRALAEVVAMWDAGIAQYEALSATVRGPAEAPSTVEERLLAEMQAGRTWDRLRRRLDKAPTGATVHAIVNELRAASDLAGLVVLREEGAAYFADEPNTAGMLVALLNDAEAALRPEIASLHEVAAEVDRARVGFVQSAGSVRSMIEGRMGATVASVWDWPVASYAVIATGNDNGLLRVPDPMRSAVAEIPKANVDYFGKHIAAARAAGDLPPRRNGWEQ